MLDAPRVLVRRAGSSLLRSGIRGMWRAVRREERHCSGEGPARHLLPALLQRHPKDGDLVWRSSAHAPDTAARATPCQLSQSPQAAAAGS